MSIEADHRDCIRVLHCKSCTRLEKGKKSSEAIMSKDRLGKAPGNSTCVSTVTSLQSRCQQHVWSASQLEILSICLLNWSFLCSLTELQWLEMCPNKAISPCDTNCHILASSLISSESQNWIFCNVRLSQKNYFHIGSKQKC